MENDTKKIRNRISNIIALILIIVAIIMYKKYDFNFYTKGIQKTGITLFSIL